MSKRKIKKLWYTNGEVEIQVDENSIPPEGFHRGRHPKMSSIMAQNRIDGTITTWNKGIPASEEQKAKQSKSMKGHIPWNKGLTKETDSRVKRASEKLMGHECFVTDWETAKQKEYETKKERGTSNSSQPEEDLYYKLCEQYGAENVEHPYRESRYPFKCDFYIKPLDLFIELNYTWEHGPHPFDENNPDDIEMLNLWKARYAKGKLRYKDAIKWWTEIDPKKLNYFKKNKLNYKIIYEEITITN